jgi:cysteine desulfurase
MEFAYLDHAAATPLRPAVRDAMLPLLEGLTGNASSTHRWGRRANSILEDARSRVATRMGVRSSEVVFARGGTESINLAILGRAGWALSGGMEAPALVRSAIEHSAVAEAMDALGNQGVRVEVLPVLPDGEIRHPAAHELRSGSTILVSVQWVNHETGIELPVATLASLCREAGVPLHVDASQAIGKVPSEGHFPDLLSISGSKLGGPASSGALIVRDGTELRPLIFGGGHERNLRPGTPDVIAAVGLATALERAVDTCADESERLAGLRDQLQSELEASISGMRVHGEEASRAPHILSIGVPGMPRDLLPGALDLEGIGVSAGSACRSGSTEVSPVLSALYGPGAAEFAPLRISMGWTTTPDEVALAASTIPRVVERIRAAGVGS